MSFLRRLKISKYLRSYFVAVFSFILGCMVTINLTPVDKTCKVENTDREYNIMQNSRLKSPELIVFILSPPKNFDTRIFLRNTWLSLGSRIDVGYKFQHYFVTGTLSLNDEELSQLRSEQTTFNDMLLLPMHDSYANLTEKVLKSFEWLTEQNDFGLNYKYVLKCDEDSFVNLDELLKEIEKLEITLKTSSLLIPFNLPPEKLNHFITTNIQTNSEVIDIDNMGIYWGYFTGRSHIFTKGKWKETNWIFCDKYVPYALGGGYILSKSLVEFLGRNGNQLRMYRSEDTSVGLWLAPVNNIIRVHDIRFNTGWVSRGCLNYHLVIHNLTKNEIHTMYGNLIRNKQLCTREVQKRGPWMYNWSVPASHCCQELPIT